MCEEVLEALQHKYDVRNVDELWQLQPARSLLTRMILKDIQLGYHLCVRPLLENHTFSLLWTTQLALDPCPASLQDSNRLALGVRRGPCCLERASYFV